ncbi:PAS domain-containing protein [Flavobacterium sp. ACAM 123]|uniref:PAS domain-containing protein n=1 Tax=Flavobacterium sp. ACAM 123 TaxID=1189620 RepID=UPI000304A26B|nr:PAS domain-containing protein [Flavobacterium sp. ACAM 123]
MTEADLKSLIDELRCQNSELVRLNTRLQLSKNKAEEASKTSNLFYDFSSLGYIVLNTKGKIVQINIIGAKMLEQTTAELINSHFSLNVVSESLSYFESFLLKSKETKIRQTCKIRLISKKKYPYTIHISSSFFRKRK